MPNPTAPMSSQKVRQVTRWKCVRCNKTYRVKQDALHCYNSHITTTFEKDDEDDILGL